MDGVGTPIIGRPRPLPGHDTPNPAHNTYTLKCEEPFWCCGPLLGAEAADFFKFALADFMRGGGSLKSNSEGVIR